MKVDIASSEDLIVADYEEMLGRDLVNRTKKLEAGAGQALLKMIRRHLREGQPLPPSVSKWLGHALMLASIEPKKAGNALGLIGPKTRPKKAGKVDRDRQIVIAALAYMAHGINHSVSNSDGPGFLDLVGERFGLSLSTVQRAWDQRKALFPKYHLTRYFPPQ